MCRQKEREQRWRKYIERERERYRKKGHTRLKIFWGEVPSKYINYIYKKSTFCRKPYQRAPINSAVASQSHSWFISSLISFKT